LDDNIPPGASLAGNMHNLKLSLLTVQHDDDDDDDDAVPPLHNGATARRPSQNQIDGILGQSICWTAPAMLEML
jgi:hypothetical protein